MATVANRAHAFDVFLSHSHRDAALVESLATRLEDEHALRVWLDKWILVPGTGWQREMARGLEQAASCAVCIGDRTPKGWFRMEIENALNRQAQDPEFRAIPVLLPNASRGYEDKLRATFLDLNTWVDFRASSDPEYQFYLLVCGVKGVAPGRWVPRMVPLDDRTNAIKEKLRQLSQLRQERLVDDQVVLEYQRKIVERLLDD